MQYLYALDLCNAISLTLWTIWNTYNMVIFCQDFFLNPVCYDIFLYHFAWWTKQALAEASPSVSDISHCHSSIMASSSPTPVKHNVSWTHPVQGIIKVNAEESFCSSNRTNGIGWIFRDHGGSILLPFSKHIIADLTIHANILAIHESFLMTAASC